VQGYYEVLSGLKEGERVVTSANFLIDSESQLKGATGAMGGHQH
jgi:Cu(I)/Ag(I) efflux system membrane fusion protein